MSDTFNQAVARTPVSISPLELTLRVEPTGEGGNKYEAYYRFVLLDANGEEVEVRAGQLVDHITIAQRDAIMSFLDSMLTKAQGVLPA